MPKRLFWIVTVLLVGGLIVLSSASITESLKSHGTPYYFVLRQFFVGILPGMLALLALWRIPYKHWRKLALPGLIIAIGLLVLVLFPGFGDLRGGSRSWLAVGAFSFQPAEFVKLALVVYLAAWLGKGGDRLGQWHYGLLPFAIILGTISVLLFLQPDIGTLAIMMAIAAGMYFASDTSLKQTMAIAAVGLAVIALIVAVSPERLSRITTVFNPNADPQGSDYQLNQALIAIGAGGIWGVGLQESTQKFDFLPEPIGDSIFAVLVEELGLVGGGITVLLFGALGFTLIGIARRAPDAFGALLAAGMFTWVMVQAGINMAAITGIGPLTGVPLPFISYGGTSMVSLLAGMGIVLNVAEHA